MPPRLDEEAVVRALWSRFSNRIPRVYGRRNQDPLDDDAVWVSNDRLSKLVVFKNDMLVSLTDAPKQMSPKQLASKAVTASVSDFAAKGVKPSYGLISIALPRTLANSEYVEGLARGFDQAARMYKLQMLGGDTNESSEGTYIDVILAGFSECVVTRSGARPGHLVGVSGCFGLQPAGLLLLQGKARSTRKRTGDLAIQSVLEPKARLSLGLAIRDHVSSCTDSSDGLVLSLYHLAEASGVDIVIRELPICQDVREFAEKNSFSEEELVFRGGEEYELVCTFERVHAPFLERLGLKVIGEVLRPKRVSSPVVVYKQRRVARSGWTHLSR